MHLVSCTLVYLVQALGRKVVHFVNIVRLFDQLHEIRRPYFWKQYKPLYVFGELNTADFNIQFLLSDPITQFSSCIEWLSSNSNNQSVHGTNTITLHWTQTFSSSVYIECIVLEIVSVSVLR